MIDWDIPPVHILMGCWLVYVMVTVKATSID